MNAPTRDLLGVVPGLSIEAYHATPPLSHSQLRDFARSPAHYYALHRAPGRPPRTEKAGQLEGDLAHCALLEPEEFERRYVTLPEDAPRRPSVTQREAKKPSADTLAAIDWWDDWAARSSVARTITHEQRETALRQADSVRALPEVAELLRTGAAEQSAFWIDAETGLHLRCRPDWIYPCGSRSAIPLDVKTCSDASPRGFALQIARKGYHTQDAMYSEGWSIAAGVDVLGFVFVAVESVYPWAACAVMVDDEGREAARVELRRLLTRFAECERTGVWPGYSGGIEAVRLPAWAVREESATFTPTEEETTA